MQKNKFTTYLLYAIGEIVLVVIGILIALQINNWNTIKKNVALEKELLSQMKEELEGDLIMLREAKGMSEVALAGGNFILKAVREKRHMDDSLATHFSYTTIPFVFFVPRTSTYENLKSLGFQFISNKKLRNTIQELYTTFEKAQNGQRIFQEEFLITINLYSLEHFDQSNRNRPFDWNALIEDKYFANLMANYVEVHGMMLEEILTSVEENIKHAIEEIEAEISN